MPRYNAVISHLEKLMCLAHELHLKSEWLLLIAYSKNRQWRQQKAVSARSESHLVCYHAGCCRRHSVRLSLASQCSHHCLALSLWPLGAGIYWRRGVDNVADHKQRRQLPWFTCLQDIEPAHLGYRSSMSCGLRV